MENGNRVGRYVLETSLGGGMATVYRAHDTVMERTVAVKVLKQVEDGGQAKERFLHEAKVAALLTHENVVRIYDYGEDDQNRAYMVMEYVPGQDLSKAIRSGLPGGLRSKLEMALDIGRALEYIHSHGIVHRDVKPENICVTTNGRVKLMDFGIAKVSSVSMTQTGFTVGTPPYMAPEQIRAQPVTAATDIYAFGLVLYEMIAGKKAFQAEHYEQVFYKVLNEAVDESPLREAGAGPDVCRLIRSCAAKDAAQRPQSFHEVCLALERIIGASPNHNLGTGAAAGTRSQDISAAGGALAKWMSIARNRRGIAIGAAALAIIVAAGLVVIPLAKNKKIETRLPPSIQTRTGEMVLIPAGQFLFGKNRQPETLPDYYIDKTEVTNADYGSFCRATGRPAPPDFEQARPDYPVVNVMYTDAQAFANWAGKRLPTLQEWEKAARGIDGRAYPWGDDATPMRANVAEGKKGGPARALSPVGAFQAGASPYGALNLVGNVWEFVEGTTQVSPETLAFLRQRNPSLSANDTWVRIRGGSAAEPLDPTTAWSWMTWPAQLRNRYIGFRCAKNPEAR